MKAYLPAIQIEIIERDISRDVQPYVYDDNGAIVREKTDAEFNAELQSREGQRRFVAQIRIKDRETKLMSGWFADDTSRRVALDSLGYAITASIATYIELTNEPKAKDTDE